MNLILKNKQDYSLIILRIALGTIFFAHGAQKLFGWFGGFGFSGTLQFFEERLNIPPALTVIVIIVEFFGGLFLLIGLLTRVASLFIAIDMIVALLLVHLPQGFFISGQKTGIEFVFALSLTAIYLAINGAGSLSLDRLIKEKVQGGTLEKLL